MHFGSYFASREFILRFAGALGPGNNGNGITPESRPLPLYGFWKQRYVSLDVARRILYRSDEWAFARRDREPNWNTIAVDEWTVAGRPYRTSLQLFHYV